MASKTGASTTASLENPAVGVTAQTPSEANTPHRRRRVQWFKHGDRWFNRLVRLLGVLHEGFWLGWLSAEDLNTVTADFYEQSREYSSPEHNLRGFFDWETSALSRYFPPGPRILVAAAGGGREVLALRRAGFQAEGFECNPMLVRASQALFGQLSETHGVVSCASDKVPPGAPEYNGLIVGWTAYTHIPTRRRRVAFLQALRQRALPASPVLLSFFIREGSSRYETLVYRIARVCRFVLRGRKEVSELGDHLHWSYSHSFTREELEAELTEAGFRLVHFSTAGEGHAVAIAE